MRTADAVPVIGEEMEGLRRRVEARQLLDSDFLLLGKILATVHQIGLLLQKKRASMRRLKQMLFGARTEKMETVVGMGAGENPPKAKSKGHGRRRSQEYWGACRQQVRHPELQVGQRCPECGHGSLYELKSPSVQMYFTAAAPIQAMALECQRMRCSGCGIVFTAPPPPRASQKYDSSVGSIISLLRYGNGMPNYRLAHLQYSLGVPLPPSVQWELALRKAESCGAVLYMAFLRQAAQGKLIYLDDTGMKVIVEELRQSISLRIAILEGPDSVARGRKGTYTTAMVSITEERQIVVYTTGKRQAGENMDRLLAQRAGDLASPIQMCDGLQQNIPKQFQVILANCNCHARRRFVDLVEDFPQAVGIVLYSFLCVYLNEEQAVGMKLSPQERLAYHQLRSGLLMEGLRAWMGAQMERKKVEPNSELGKAFSYFLKHWNALTLFLRVPGAPLDNNLCERIIKRAIMHRKNSLFYRTFTGALVGDIFMSIISTCVQNKINPFHYLTEIEKHAAEVRADPDRWLPWNYLQRLINPPAQGIPA